MSVIEQIQAWYASQCNGDWEHQNGVSIDTLDNPGWSVSINLAGTELEGAMIPPYRQDSGEDDWVFCEIKDRTFIGNGDPSKLVFILDMFTSLLPK